MPGTREDRKLLLAEDFRTFLCASPVRLGRSGIRVLPFAPAVPRPDSLRPHCRRTLPVTPASAGAEVFRDQTSEACRSDCDCSGSAVSGDRRSRLARNKSARPRPVKAGSLSIWSFRKRTKRRASPCNCSGATPRNRAPARHIPGSMPPTAFAPAANFRHPPTLPGSRPETDTLHDHGAAFVLRNRRLTRSMDFIRFLFSASMTDS